MVFNNHGSEIVSRRIANDLPSGLLGINIGPNKDTVNKEEDFIYVYQKLSSYAGYITINISSPNTEGLRNFHDQTQLEKLLKGIKNKNIAKPIVIKISPDIKDSEISKIIEIIIKLSVKNLNLDISNT